MRVAAWTPVIDPELPLGLKKTGHLRSLAVLRASICPRHCVTLSSPSSGCGCSGSGRGAAGHELAAWKVTHAVQQSLHLQAKILLMIAQEDETTTDEESSRVGISYRRSKVLETQSILVPSKQGLKSAWHITCFKLSKPA